MFNIFKSNNFDQKMARKTFLFFVQSGVGVCKMSNFSSEASFNEILICRLLPLNSHLLLLLPFLRVSRHHQTLKVMVIVIHDISKNTNKDLSPN